MILCLDVGNTQIFGGVFDGDQMLLNFRHDSRSPSSSDELGIFFRHVLQENGLAYKNIKKIGLGSVVPHLDYTIRSSCIKYFGIEPFILDATTQKNLKVLGNPGLGADRVATSIAAIHDYPNKNLIVVDFGTATTYDAISAKKEYMGGLILAGIRLSMAALQNNTAKLFPVEILKPDSILGTTTQGHLQAGLYYGQLGAMHLITQNLIKECFPSEEAVIIGTGGFGHLFERENFFTAINPNLVLQGIRLALLSSEQ